MKSGDIFEAEILSLSYGGQAVAKKDGIVFFGERGVPGDIARLKVKKIKKNYASAELVKLLHASRARIDSGCRAFESGCGGCQWLNVNYADQLYWKTKIVRDALKHIGKINKEVLPTSGMKNPFRYRNKVSTHKNGQGRIGLMKFNSHEIICFQECRQVLKANEELYKAINEIGVPRHMAQVHLRSTSQGETGICLYAERNDREFSFFARRLQQDLGQLKGVGLSLPAGFQSLAGEGSLRQEINSLTYYFPLNGFFQTNFIQAEVLQREVLKHLQAASEGLVVDLYCGSGFFTLPLAKKASMVYGIENHRESIECARLSARINKIDNVRFVCRDAAEFLSGFAEKPVAALVLDPPRTGCAREVLSQIIRLKPRKIVYVSCAPDTLARDLSVLQGSGYAIEVCQPIDMFPHTYHVELVVGLALINE